MAWSDYFPFIQTEQDHYRDEEARATRIRHILDDIQRRHGLEYEGRSLADVGRELEMDNGDPEAGIPGEQMAPGWRNADEFRAATQDVDDEDRQGYMSPDRYAYMQEVGRDADFLANVEANPKKALQYWDRSNGAHSTRRSLWSPNYQRYSPFLSGLLATVNDRRSVIGKALQNIGVMSNIAQDFAGGTPLGDAMQNANALNQLQQRSSTGENPVGTLPPARPGATPDELSREFLDNQAYLKDMESKVQPRSGQYIANGAARALTGEDAPRAVGDATALATSMVDPTLLSGLMTSVPQRATAPA